MAKWGYDIQSIRDMKERVKKQCDNNISDANQALDDCQKFENLNPWSSGTVTAVDAQKNGMGESVSALKESNNRIKNTLAEEAMKNITNPLNAIEEHYNNAQSNEFLKIKNVRNGVEDYFTLFDKYNAKLTGFKEMCGHPGGGWKKISFKEKLTLAADEGNTEAMMDLIQQMIDKGDLSEAELLKLLFGDGMNVPSFETWKQANPGKEWNDYLNVFFGGKQDNYEIYLSVQKFIDKRITEQYGKPIEQMTKEELVKWLVKMGFKEGEIQKYDEAYLRSMLLGAEQSKMVAAVMLYQKNKSGDISVYYDSAVYNREYGVKITAPTHDLKPVGVCQYISYSTNTSSNYPVAKSENEIKKGDIDEISAFCKTNNGSFSVEVNKNTTETYTISRAGNENIGLQQENKKDKDGNPLSDPIDEIGSNAMNQIVTACEVEVKKAKNDLEKAKNDLFYTIADCALEFVPGGDALSSAMNVVRSMTENQGLLDGTEQGLNTFNKTVKGHFKTTEEARLAISKGVSSVNSVTSAIDKIKVANEALEQAKKDLEAEKQTKHQQDVGGYIIKDSSGNIIGGSNK